MDNYLEDTDFVSAIVEDYVIILKTLDFQIRALEELEKMDKYHPFLKNHNVKDLYELEGKIKQESNEFDIELENRKPKPTETVYQYLNKDGEKVEEKDSVYI